MDVSAQKRGDNTKSKRTPKVQKVRAKTTKKPGSRKVKVVKPRSASGRSGGNYKSVTPSYTPRRSAPAIKKVVPKSASGRVPFKNRKRATPSGSSGFGYKGKRTTPRTASSGFGHSGKSVRPRSGSSGFGYKNKVVRARSGSTGYGFKNKIIRPRTASSGYGFGSKTVRPRTGSTGFNFAGRGKVRPRSASSGYSYRKGKVTPRSASTGFNFRKGASSPRSASGNFRYGGGDKRPRSATGQLKFKNLGVSPRFSNHSTGPDVTKVQIRSVKRSKKFRVVNVNPRTTPKRVKFKPGEKVKGRAPEKNTTPSLFVGGLKFKGRGPKIAENTEGRKPAGAKRKMKIRVVEPRSILSNPTYRRSSNQTKLVSFPKDVSTMYVGTLKAKRGHKQKSKGSDNLNYSGNVKHSRPVKRKIGGDLRTAKPSDQRLNKSDYLKSRSKAQWASYYRDKTKKQSDFKGFQKVKYNNKKWMHPSVGHRLGRFVNTYKAREKVRKIKLWISRRQKNDDQPKYLKGKPKKKKYDKDEIKIWSDYDNSRGKAEGVKDSEQTSDEEINSDQ